MDLIPALTAMARISALVPLILFFVRQAKVHGKNGNTGRVRRGTLGVVAALILAFGNLVLVNLEQASGANLLPNQLQYTVACLTSTGLAAALWHLWGIFDDVQHHG